MTAARVLVGTALVLAAVAPPASATTLVVLVSHRTIVVGADSMRTLASGGREAVCKIRLTDGVVYAFAGAVGSEAFDAAAIAARQIEGSGTLADKAHRTAEALQVGLVEHFRTRPVDSSRRELLERHRGRPVTGFVAAMVDGKPEVWVVLVQAEPASEGLTLTNRVEQLDTKGPDRAIFLSPQHREVIARANQTMVRHGRVSAEELAAEATELVGLDIQLEEQRALPQRRSGPPIAIAVVDRSGLRYATPGVCTAGPGRD